MMLLSRKRKHVLQPADNIQQCSPLGISLPPGLEAPVRVSKEKALELYMGVVNKLAENKLQKEAEDERMRSQKQGLKEAVENANPRDLFDQAVRQVLRDTTSALSSSHVAYVLAYLGVPAAECLRDPTSHETTSKGKGKGNGKWQGPRNRLRKVRTSPNQQPQPKKRSVPGRRPWGQQQPSAQ